MNITVILATHNRAYALTDTLEELAASKIADSVEWEVVVVDNNSTDGTREVVEDFCRRYPGRFRYMFEPRWANPMPSTPACVRQTATS